MTPSYFKVVDIINNKDRMNSLIEKVLLSKHYKPLEGRMKSFIWRFGLAFAVGLLGVLTGYLEGLNSSEALTVLLVYVLNEVTKHLNKKSKK